MMRPIGVGELTRRSAALIGAVWLLLPAGATAQTQVLYSAETLPTASSQAGDVAVLVNRADPSRSLVLGTDPSSFSGLYAFALDGGSAQTVSQGIVRGIDTKRGARGDVVIVSAPSTAVLLFGLDDAGVLGSLNAHPFLAQTPESVALSVLRDGGFEAWVDDRSTSLRHFVLVDNDGGLDAVAVDGDSGVPSIALGGLPTSITIDDRWHRLYAAVSQVGLVRVDLDDAGLAEVVEPVDGGMLGGPISGLALYPLRDGGALLLTTVPQLSDIVVYTASPALAYVTRFQIVSDAGTLVTLSQYLDVTPAGLPGYENGLLVVHSPNNPIGANYKYVRWDVIAAATTPHLPVEVLVLDAGTVSLDGGVDGGTDAGSDGGSGGGGGGAGGGGGTGGGAGGGGGGSAGGTGGAGGSSSSNGGGPQEGPGGGCRCDSSQAALLPGAIVMILALRRRSRRSA